MKDGIATVYINPETFREFIIKQGGFDEDTLLEFARPTYIPGEDIDIEIKVAFSNTSVPPCNWGGDIAEEVNEIIKSWE